MKKIHSDEKPKHRGLSTLGKLVLVAAILASLALPVMAATGFHFTDWLDDMFKNGSDYDTDLQIGSSGKNWEISGWVINLTAEDTSPTGMRVVYEQWGNAEKEGTLTTDESFWIEKWNGSGYEKLTDPAKAFSAGETIAIQPNTTEVWAVDWTDTYGELESGSYRLGKNFTYTNPSGMQEQVVNYVKFRVFTEDMAPYIEACKAYVKELQTRDSYHMTETIYPGEEDYAYYTKEIWKNGKDFLIERQYIREDGSLKQRDGYLYRDGKGYKLSWIGDNVLSGVASWEKANWLNESQLDMWTTFLSVWDFEVGEVFVEENTISLLLGWTSMSDSPDYRELSYTLDDQNRIVSAQIAKVPGFDYSEEEREVFDAIVVHDTSDAEITKVIASQNVDKPTPFFWQEEQAQYPAGTEGVKTEGFVNTTVRTIADAQDAIAAAQAECTLEWQNTAVVFYDEAADMWKVELGHSQDDSYQAVYLDSQGITRLVVTE